MGTLFQCCQNDKQTDLVARNKNDSNIKNLIPPIDSDKSVTGSNHSSQKSPKRKKSFEPLKTIEEEKLETEEKKLMFLEKDKCKLEEMERKLKQDLENEKIKKFLLEQHALEKKILDDKESDTRKKSRELKSKTNSSTKEETIEVIGEGDKKGDNISEDGVETKKKSSSEITKLKKEDSKEKSKDGKEKSNEKNKEITKENKEKEGDAILTNKFKLVSEENNNNNEQRIIKTVNININDNVDKQVNNQKFISFDKEESN